MNWTEITAAIGAIKYLVPALETAWSTLKAMLPQDKADIVAAVKAVEKAFGDLKTGFVALEAGIKAAIAAK